MRPHEPLDGLRFRRARADDRGARRCLSAYYDELGRAFPTGFDPDEWEPLDPADTDPPSGSFLVVLHSSDAVGCGAVKTLSPGVGEIKRMWLDPSLRNRGIGRRLLTALETEARALGHRVVRLDTSAHLTTARRLYLATGYQEIDAYNDNPYAGHWFEKDLGPDRAGR